MYRWRSGASRYPGWCPLSEQFEAPCHGSNAAGWWGQAHHVIAYLKGVCTLVPTVAVHRDVVGDDRVGSWQHHRKVSEGWSIHEDC